MPPVFQTPQIEYRHREDMLRHGNHTNYDKYILVIQEGLLIKLLQYVNTKDRNFEKFAKRKILASIANIVNHEYKHVYHNISTDASIIKDSRSFDIRISMRELLLTDYQDIISYPFRFGDLTYA